jgi:hypothetical protein
MQSEGAVRGDWRVIVTVPVEAGVHACAKDNRPAPGPVATGICFDTATWKTPAAPNPFLFATVFENFRGGSIVGHHCRAGRDFSLAPASLA